MIEYAEANYPDHFCLVLWLTEFDKPYEVVYLAHGNDWLLAGSDGELTFYNIHQIQSITVTHWRQWPCMNLTAEELTLFLLLIERVFGRGYNADPKIEGHTSEALRLD